MHTEVFRAKSEFQLKMHNQTSKCLTPISRKLLIPDPVHTSWERLIAVSGAADKVPTDDCNQRRARIVGDQGTSARVSVASAPSSRSEFHLSVPKNVLNWPTPRSRTCSSRNGVHLCMPNTALKWLTPISWKPQMRPFSSQTAPVPSQGSTIPALEATDKVATEKSSLNDFDWHAHMSMGSFIYNGQILVIKTISLQEYSLKNPMLELRPIYGDSTGRLTKFVKEEAKSHTWHLVNSLSEFHRIGLCIVDLDHSKVVLCDGVPKFIADISFVPATDELIEENFRQLEKIIRGTLFRGESLPYHINHLLHLMKTDCIKSLGLMKCHVALVRQVHKTAFFMRMYDLIEALRLGDYEAWITLLRYLPYKYSWLRIMVKNELLFACLMRKRSDKSDPRAALFYILEKLYYMNPAPEKFVQKYRSLSAHKMDDSIDPITGEVLYTKEQFEDILEADLPVFLVDLQHKLHMMGKLDLALLDSFFGVTISQGTISTDKMLILLKKGQRQQL